MNPFFSKSIFLWKTPCVAGGDAVMIADLLQRAGFEAVIVKMADGPYAYQPGYAGWSENLPPELAAALRSRGIAVLGYGFLYGATPRGEAAIAVTQTHKYRLDGYVFDVEGPFDSRSNAEANAYTVMANYLDGCPNTPTAFCSWALWRSPKTGAAWHPEAVCRAFMASCTVGMPMIYWGGETPGDMSWWMTNSLAQWKKLTDKPLVPAGRAYIGDGGKPRPDAMLAFEAGVRAGGVAGVSWWSMQHALNLTGIWTTLAGMDGFQTSPLASLPEGEGRIIDWARAVDQWARSLGYAGPGVG